MSCWAQPLPTASTYSCRRRPLPRHPLAKLLPPVEPEVLGQEAAHTHLGVQPRRHDVVVVHGEGPDALVVRPPLFDHLASRQIPEQRAAIPGAARLRQSKRGREARWWFAASIATSS